MWMLTRWGNVAPVQRRPRRPNAARRRSERPIAARGRSERPRTSEPAQEVEKREDGRAAEQVPPHPSKAGRPKVSFAEQTLEQVLAELPDKTLMKKTSKEKPSSGSFDLWEQLKQMPIAMTAAQLLELVPRFRDRLVKDISAESTKERTSQRNDKR